MPLCLLSILHVLGSQVVKDLCVNGTVTTIEWTCDSVNDVFSQTAEDISKNMGIVSLGC